MFSCYLLEKEKPAVCSLYIMLCSVPYQKIMSIKADSYYYLPAQAFEGKANMTETNFDIPYIEK